MIGWFSFPGTISCCSLRKLGRLYILQWEIPKGRIRVVGIIRRKNPKQCNSVFQSSQYCGSFSWKAVLYSWTSICDCSQRYNYWKGNHHKKSFDGNCLWSCVQHTQVNYPFNCFINHKKRELAMVKSIHFKSVLAWKQSL